MPSHEQYTLQTITRMENFSSLKNAIISSISTTQHVSSLSSCINTSLIILVTLLISTVRSNHPKVFWEESFPKFQLTLFYHKGPKDWKKIYDDEPSKNDLLDIFF